MQQFYETAEIAKNYHKFRPSHCEELANEVIAFHRSQQQNTLSSEKLDLLVDVGCGNGQSSNIFQSHFKHIVGVDVSAEQIKQAKKQNVHKHIQYVEGCAEELPSEENSVDLIVSGVSVHWFDLPKFFSECKRVLKPNGCIAIFGYWVPKLTPMDNQYEVLSKKGTELFEQFVLSGVSNNPAEKKAYFLIKQRYHDIFDMIPFEVKQRVDNIHLVFDSSMNEICGFIRSTDSYYSHMDKVVQDLKKKYGKVTKEDIDAKDVAMKFTEDLKTLWNLKTRSDDEKVIIVDFNYYILLARP